METSSGGLAGEADEGSVWTRLLPHGLTLPFQRAGGEDEQGVQKQIPRGKDGKKGKDNSKCRGQYRGLSTALRFGRDDGV